VQNEPSIHLCLERPNGPADTRCFHSGLLCAEHGAGAEPPALLGIKLVGAGYLFYLAVQLWRAQPEADSEAGRVSMSRAGLARQEFLVAIGNPKAILLFTAFLPQFVDRTGTVTQQFAVLGGLFLALECIAIGLYCYMGIYARRLFARPSGKRLFNRMCSGLLASAASFLLVARRS
jgi:threonine/homoserine/homoserine lactone efflux protein